MQDQDGPVVDRQAGEGSIEEVGRGGPVVEGAIGRGSLTAFVRVRQSKLANAPAASTSQLRPAGVQVDPPQPGVEQVRVAQGLAVAPGRHEGLLGRVGSVGLIAKDRH